MHKSFPAAELAGALGSRPVRWDEIVGGGYTRNTQRWRVELEDGRSIFVKLALDDLAAGWLRDERRVYAAVEAEFLARFLGWYDHEVTFLVLEDLAGAHWPPPWRAGDVDAAHAALDAIHATAPPSGLPALEGLRDRLNGWVDVAADPEPFLSTGLCSAAWLEAALPVLEEAAASCGLGGDTFLHLDFRSDNLCLAGTRVVVVDWNHACVGNGELDLAAWLPSLRLEGGPEPWELMPESNGLAALLAGFFAARAGLPPPPTAAPRVRDFQGRQAEVALPWAARELGLTLPS